MVEPCFVCAVVDTLVYCLSETLKHNAQHGGILMCELANQQCDSKSVLVDPIRRLDLGDGLHLSSSNFFIAISFIHTIRSTILK